MYHLTRSTACNSSHKRTETWAAQQLTATTTGSKMGFRRVRARGARSRCWYSIEARILRLASRAVLRPGRSRGRPGSRRLEFSRSARQASCLSLVPLLPPCDLHRISLQRLDPLALLRMGHADRARLPGPLIRSRRGSNTPCRAAARPGRGQSQPAPSGVVPARPWAPRPMRFPPIVVQRLCPPCR